MKHILTISAVALCACFHVAADAQSGGEKVRAAQLLDFSQQPRGAFVLGEKVPVSEAVKTAMVDGFVEAGPVEGEAEVFAVRSAMSAQYGDREADGGFIRSPAIRVPEWMRTGRSPMWDQVMPVGLPAMGSCGPRAYSPSGLIGAQAEERRRVLFPSVVVAACRYGIPVGLFDALIMQESRYNPMARSPKGAFGLGQLMPGTARQLGVNAYDLRDNLDGAARYLSDQLTEFGDPRLALAAYNAGPGRVKKLGRVPNISETRHYVRTIMWNWQSLEMQGGL